MNNIYKMNKRNRTGKGKIWSMATVEERERKRDGNSDENENKCSNFESKAREKETDYSNNSFLKCVEQI